MTFSAQLPNQLTAARIGVHDKHTIYATWTQKQHTVRTPARSNMGECPFPGPGDGSVMTRLPSFSNWSIESCRTSPLKDPARKDATLSGYHRR